MQDQRVITINIQPDSETNQELSLNQLNKNRKLIIEKFLFHHSQVISHLSQLYKMDGIKIIQNKRTRFNNKERKYAKDKWNHFEKDRNKEKGKDSQKDKGRSDYNNKDKGKDKEKYKDREKGRDKDREKGRDKDRGKDREKEKGKGKDKDIENNK